MVLAQYVLRDGCYLPGEVRTAIITKKANDGENLDLTVFVHPNDFPSDHVASNGLLQVRNVPHDESKALGTWHYLTIATPAVEEEAPPAPVEEQLPAEEPQEF